MEAEVFKFLPEELIEYQMNAEERRKAVADAQVIMRRKRKKIQISTDSVSDLSREYVKRYELKIMYQYIETERGSFRDTREIDAGNLARHLSDPGRSVRAVSPSIEEFENFYAEALTEAEEMIYISMASNTGKSYANAVAAAKGFDNVHVIDTGHISCGEGLLVLIAADMVHHGCTSAEEICNEVNHAKKYVESSYILQDIRRFYEGGFTNRLTAAVCQRLDLHPVLHMKNSQLRICGFRFGKMDAAKRRYIRRSLCKKKQIDERVVFIIHAGCSVRQQKDFVDEVLKNIPFEKVIIQKVSVSCASNAGIGTMGLAYLTKSKGKTYDENRAEEYENDIW